MLQKINPCICQYNGELGDSDSNLLVYSCLWRSRCQILLTSLTAVSSAQKLQRLHLESYSEFDHCRLLLFHLTWMHQFTASPRWLMWCLKENDMKANMAAKKDRKNIQHSQVWAQISSRPEMLLLIQCPVVVYLALHQDESCHDHSVSNISQC